MRPSWLIAQVHRDHVTYISRALSFFSTLTPRIERRTICSPQSKVSYLMVEICCYSPLDCVFSWVWLVRRNNAVSPIWSWMRSSARVNLEYEAYWSKSFFHQCFVSTWDIFTRGKCSLHAIFYAIQSIIRIGSNALMIIIARTFQS